ncbi:hypothetical protein E6C76_13435 [Pseudothauera nasutitermitis]|uniref:MSHA biogenesis protein MshP n=1 Tax=Pseudothauera nasutitermitis TaxID=2565930 RepID=A0A4S4AWG8_9RHOO|nr:hypothetical protein [Pseudothauera nasutitermitis]THF63595.1 hypothetical protein E6C76_13435 [Pseudothauera nasutitermitis]
MNRQRGFSIIAVIFILVVLAGLGVVIAQLGATQHLGVLAAQEGRQAWYAARAGLEVGRQRAEAGTCTETDTFTFQGFTITWQCQENTGIWEGDDTLSVYALTSTATRNDGVLGQIAREAQMTLWTSP